MQTRAPDKESLTIVRDAFFSVHIYSGTVLSEDLEIIRKQYSQWRNEK